MLFSSIPFLYTFLPCVLILYFLVPGWLKNTVLLLSSLFFYAWGEPRFVVFMVIAIVQGYVFGLLAEKFRDRPKRAKLCLWASAVVSLGLLCYCKYADFFISGFNTLTGLSLPLLHVALPIGISFYTFQILSYVIDVYRGDVTAQRNLIDLAAYVAMFPQLIAGPIVRYADIAPQLKRRTHTLADAAYGARRFILGLSKKVLLANVLYELISAYKSAANVSVLFVWLYAAAYVLHLYFDFSGYSDMAIGLGRIFGFHFIENFNYLRQRHGVLAAVAHEPGQLVPGLCVHPAGRQPGLQGQMVPQHFHCLAADGPVARRGVDLHPVGTVLCRVPDGGKALVRRSSGPDTIPEASLCSAADRSQLRFL